MGSFYLENDISRLTAQLLRAGGGHDALLTRGHGRSRATDDQQLLTALELDRILATHNGRDFVLLHHSWRLMNVDGLIR